ncbi:hypothetical protein GCM10007377_15830 [Galliscardovia ingluviei]|uniref:Uncharacterized protein n=1 Tax=Galliscardovia ingluviei TaxID=1769422 RepID=A0A8J3EZY5_9BIFI|nr:hypothetical protein [Galliscardovia ingluviei]GGI15424.1 hypothetical protein GCM10007377_15830 [Galliscardovia ingluviei]
MSVAIVGNTGINAIAHAASSFIYEYGQFLSTEEKLPITTFDITTIGQYLYQRNMDAFNQRYCGDNPAPQFKPYYSDDISPVFTLAAIDAYLYQVSDLYDDKLTYLLTQARLYTIETMDGYDEAWRQAMSN